ncbi:LOW QUALITY PROTEIN: homoserine dehydrogenase [Bacillus sp. JCM 19046]|nr:LOW QUALITY PROTEIN: homoserine dehydrogenase [Bacillus sp. JCM 19046]
MFTLKIGLIGFGTVGTGIYERLIRTRGDIEKVTGQSFTIEAILIKDKLKKRRYPTEQFVSSWEEFKSYGPYDFVFEAMNGIDLAKMYTGELLSEGTTVISANKKLVATHGQMLDQIAKEAGVYYGWDAAVCGVIPIVNSLKSVFLTTEIYAITGVLNGTTNYILTKMATGQTYEDSLQEARLLGYAEEDPTDDVDGWDAVYKTCLLAKSCYNKWLNIEDVKRSGISQVEAWHASGAKEFGWSLKLVGELVYDGEDCVKGSVQPTIIVNDHVLSTVDGVMNGICLDGEAIDQILIAGAGAGKAPTANSAVEDFVFHQKHHLFKRKSSLRKKRRIRANNWEGIVVCRGRSIDSSAALFREDKILDKRTVKEGMIFYVESISETPPFPIYPCLSKELESKVSQKEAVLKI